MQNKYLKILLDFHQEEETMSCVSITEAASTDNGQVFAKELK